MKRSPMKPRKTRMPASGKGGLRSRKPTKRKGRTTAERARIYGTDEHQAWMRAHGCLACARVPVELAHTRNGGMGRKGDATDCVPLCSAHHRELHQLGTQSFERIHANMLCRRTLRDWAAQYADAWSKWSGLTPLSAIVPGVLASIMEGAE